jgi:hypothetical protein
MLTKSPISGIHHGASGGSLVISAAALLAIVLMLPAAARSASADIAGKLAHARQVLIVPIEAPPLVFESPGQTQIAANALSLGVANSGTTTPPVITAAGAPVAAGTALVGLFAASAAAKDNTALTMEVVRALSADGSWLPSRVTANIAASELGKRGVTTVQIRERMEPIPGVPPDAHMSIFMIPWWVALDHYYSSTQSPFSYGAPEVEADDLVLEVAVFGYDYPGGMLRVGVRLKLVAPATGTVITKSSAWVLGRTSNTPELFANGGEQFKARFAELAQKATEKAFKKIGL